MLFIYSFQFRHAFLPRRPPGGTAAYMVYPISDIGRRRKYREVSCTERTFQGNDFEWIPTVKMETRHLVEGYFGSKISGDL